MKNGLPVLNDKGMPKIRHYNVNKSTTWRDLIGWLAKTKAPAKPWTGPIRFDREYIFMRPKKPKHNFYHIVKPDTDNLDKAVMDAVKGIIWKDDCQVCEGSHVKRYVQLGEVPGVIITFTLLEKKGNQYV